MVGDGARVVRRRRRLDWHDTCTCDEGWHGGQCEFRPSCEFWDVELNAFSSAGCTLQSYDPSSGEVLCACNHLTEFGTIVPIALGVEPDIRRDLYDLPLYSRLSIHIVVSALVAASRHGYKVGRGYVLGRDDDAFSLGMHVLDERSLHSGFMPTCIR